MENLNRILQSVQSNLVFLTTEELVEPYITDIGLILSKAISDKLENENLAFIAYDKLHQLLEKNAIQHDLFGTVYAIKNIGILFEPELKFDFVSICKKYSRDSTFIIEHQGDIGDKYLYFLTRENGKKIELTDLNYTVL